MLDILGPLFIGLVGSVHCLGMCGPLVIAYSLHVKSHSDAAAKGVTGLSWKKGLWHHLAFHSGRLLSYGGLGFLAAGLLYAAGSIHFFREVRGALTLAGGALMILLGFVLLKILPIPAFPMSGSQGSNLWGRLFSPLFASQRIGSKVLLGAATGFLPCGLSWAMIVKAATTHDLAQGFLTMAAFGLGTVPALFLTGFSASYVSLRTRFLGERVAALSVIAMGLILVFKGARIFV
jgi:uncharacterized protein